MLDTDLTGGITNTEIYFALDHASYDARMKSCIDVLDNDLGFQDMFDTTIERFEEMRN